MPVTDILSIQLYSLRGMQDLDALRVAASPTRRRFSYGALGTPIIALVSRR